MEEKRRTIGFICPKCRQSVVADRSLFSLSVGQMKLTCPCKESELLVDYTGTGYQFTVPCAACGGEHQVTITGEQMMDNRLLGFACPETGIDCCYIGEEGAVFAALPRLEQAMDKQQLRDKDSDSAFLDETVMEEMLGELKDIASAGRVSCTCGSKRWSVALHYSSIELRCGDCGGVLRIPAATEDDLTDLCAKGRLTIRGRK
ncbi:MAG: hypothetical protein LUH48_00745 [Clostridiales bacterium]|nr:hypothetical protein [Clostridiales bacterium]